MSNLALIIILISVENRYTNIKIQYVLAKRDHTVIESFTEKKINPSPLFKMDLWDLFERGIETTLLLILSLERDVTKMC